MASHYKVQFSVSLTPTVVIGEDQSVEANVIDEEIRKSLGGSGAVGDIDAVTMLAADDEVEGWAAGVPSYISTDGGTGATIDTTDINNIVFIKNTGYASSVASGSSTTLGDRLVRSGNWTSAAVVEVRHSAHDGTLLAELFPGEAIVFPRAGASTSFVCPAKDNAANIAIEYAIIQDGT